MMVCLLLTGLLLAEPAAIWVPGGATRANLAAMRAEPDTPASRPLALPQGDAALAAVRRLRAGRPVALPDAATAGDPAQTAAPPPPTGEP